MSFDELLGHGSILAGLWSAARAGRLPHALLFRGPAGIGKFQALSLLAHGLLCASGPGAPCGSCGPCKRTRTGNHPDLFVVDAVALEVETVPVGAVAPRGKESEGPWQSSISEFLSLCAHEGGWKIVLVREADRMTESAQNAFLKTLEEPTKLTLLALETSAPDALLATVRSRVVSVRCRALDLGLVQSILARAGIEAGAADVCARLAAGSPGRALELARQGAPEMMRRIEALELGQAGAIETARALFELEGEFPGRTPLARSRARARAVLDLLLARAAEERRRRVSERGDDPGAGSSARARMDRWFQARADVDSNLSPEAILERALLVLEPAGDPVETRKGPR